MPSQRRSQGGYNKRVVQQRTPIDGEMGGTQTVTTTDYQQTPQRASRSQRLSQGRSYLPTSVGEKAGNSVAVLEAEYFGCIFLIFLTVFTDKNASYSSKILAVMKRGTLATVLFFILALFSASGPNAARVAKAFGALVLAGIFLGTAGQGTISALDSFFKADWSSGDTTQGDTSGDAGAGQQQAPSGGQSQSVIQRIEGALAKINDILNIPGLGFIK